MVNTSEGFAARPTRKEMWKRKKRQKPQGTTDSNPSDARNRGLNRGSSDGGLEGDTWEEMEPNRYASRIVRDKGLQEIIEQVAEGDLQQYWIFITNLCAISRYLLEKAPRLYPGVKEYVGRHMESGDALLTFILDGPHPGMISQGRLPALTEDPKEPADEPDSAEQLPATSSSGTLMARRPATMAHAEGAEGQSAHPDHSPRAPQSTQAAPAGTIQRPVVTGSAPTHQQTGQQAHQGQASSGPPAQIQGAAGLNFTSYGQQPPLVSTTGPASAPMGPNPLSTGHFTSAVQPGQPSSCTLDAAHQSSAQLFPVPTAPHAQHPSHPNANPGVQPGMAQPLQMNVTHPSQPTPLNVAPIQSQMPAIHLASTQGHTSQAGQGWPVGGLSQLPSHATQAQPGPVVSHGGVQPTAVPPGQQWATNAAGSTQMPSQVPTSAQQGNAMAPAQSLPQVQAAYGQPGPLNIPAQPSAAQSQTDTAPNPLWPGQSQESMAESDFLSLGEIPPMFQ